MTKEDDTVAEILLDRFSTLKRFESNALCHLRSFNNYLNDKSIQRLIRNYYILKVTRKQFPLIFLKT